MSMRQLIGISLACLVTSACAIDKAPEESTSTPSDDPSRFRQANGETPTDKSPVSAGTLLANHGLAAHGSERVEPRLAGFESVADACGGSRNPCCSPVHPTGVTLFGKAAWYNLLGRQTASGEILDAVNATAAHRSLPLA
jgi:rare lipoprotein A (peptidoglycan hydrolase)